MTHSAQSAPGAGPPDPPRDAEPPKSEPPEAEVPDGETAAAGTSAENSAAETSAAESPAAEAPAPETPAAGSPEADDSDAERPTAETELAGEGGDDEATAPEAEAADEPMPVDEGATVTAAEAAAGGLGAELSALRTELEDRTRDLQRVSAEYANYRKRVDRDRALAGEEATANVFRALLPVFDDLDRAREHGELAEGVAAVVDQLMATAGKFGLSGFGEPGDPFDPNRHEAVAHQTAPDLTEPTCVDVLRRGYLLGDRMLRPAMVAVADPE